MALPHHHYSRRAILKLAGLAAGSTAVSIGCNAASSSSQAGSSTEVNPVSPNPMV